MIRVLALLLLATSAGAQERAPIIDMHMHASPIGALPPPPTAVCTPIDPLPAWDQRRPWAEVWGAMLKAPRCENPVWSPTTSEELLRMTVAEMERLNVFGVVGSVGGVGGDEPVIDDWLAAAPERFIAGSRCIPSMPDCSADSVRELHASGRLEVLAEIYTQLLGMAPDDERLAPYWTLAEELDIPVGIHIGTGPPGAIYLGGMEEYRARLHSSLTLEEVLVRHPRLRVYVMHAGYPLLDDMLAVLYAHPQVYVEIGVIVWQMPREGFYRYLRGLVDGGHGNRVMFGTDQLQWPGVIERSIAVIEEAPFLSEAQKRDILYNNAARFLRLSEEEMVRHRSM